MGLKGAANALALREAALSLSRPILAITALASEAETLASEGAFFLDEPNDVDAAAAMVHLLPAWELRPFAQLSPPPYVQPAQPASRYALLRQPAPPVLTAFAALTM